MSENSQPNVQHQFRCPPELEGGVYSNFIGVWHTGHEFTIDFAASMPAQQVVNDQGEQVIVVPQRVTARVKIAPTMLFEIVKALNENLTKYESKFGNITPPGVGDAQPLAPPDDWISGTLDDDDPDPNEDDDAD